ncbi:hypothetical protein D3Z50_20065 [Clostridiaceae bacterium]|nr:hypothetical protein [Clostridiaceae bacterium]
MELLNKMAGKYKGIPVQAKAAFWYVVCSFFQRGISFITIPIFTRILSVYEYGMCSVFTSWSGIWENFAGLSLSCGVFNVGMIKYEKKRKQFLASLQGLTCISTVLCFLFCLLFHTGYYRLSGMEFKLTILMFIQILSGSILSLWYAYERYEYRYKGFLGVTMISSMAGPALSVLCVLSSGDKVFARFEGIVIVQVMLCLLVCIYERVKVKEFIHLAYWKYALSFNIPLIPHYLSATMLNSSDRIMISYFCGEEKTAFYGIAGSCSMVMQVLLSAINSSITPWYFEQLKKRNYGNVRAWLNRIIGAFFCVTVLVTLFGPELLGVLATKEYYDAVYLLPVVMSSVFFLFLYGLFANIEFYYEKKSYILLASVTAAVMNIVLNAVFIPVFDYYAAGYTTLACYIFYAAAHCCFAIKILKQEGMGPVFSVKYIAVISALLLMLVAVVCFLYQFMMIRYGIAFVLMIILKQLYKKQLKRN